MNEEIVLLVGETGTGKTLAAHALHAMKGRKGELVAVNGATLQVETARSALFGHRQNAFSDAYQDRPGAFGVAEGGTLLITEGGGIAWLVQTQLLRVLQDFEAARLGDTERRRRDVHVIVTVRPDELHALRKDLLGRIARAQVEVPALRRRGADVVELAQQCLRELRPEVRLGFSAQQALRMHAWPGNVRELQNCIEQSALELPREAAVLEANDLPLRSAAAELPTPPAGTMAALLLEHRGNVAQASKAAGLKRKAFERQIEGEGYSSKQIREACRAQRKAEVQSAVAEAGSYAAASRQLGLTVEGVRFIVAKSSPNRVSRTQLERLVQAEEGDLEAVATRLGVSLYVVEQQLLSLGAFRAGRPSLEARLVVKRDGEPAVGHRVENIGCAIGPSALCEIVIDEPESPSPLAWVVRDGDGLGLRVQGGASVQVAGGRLLQARSLMVCADEAVRVGKTRIWLESTQRLAGPTRAPEAIVVVHASRRVPVDTKRGLTVGSDPECDLVIEDPFVSALHLRLCESGGQWHLVDRSKNGTFVGDKSEVHRAGPVRVPTTVRAGNTELRLEWAAAPRVPRTYGFVGDSPQMQAVFAALERAKSRRVLLVTGETGTGKELASRAFHELAGGGPLVAVNCGGIQDELLIHELFGHEKGAFTGATDALEGLVAQADGGTLFLDEIGDTSVRLQAQIVELVEQGRYTPFGADRPRQASVRIVAATNRDLRRMVGEGTFSAALLYRFGAEVHLPPLRDRGLRDLRALAVFLQLAMQQGALGKLGLVFGHQRGRGAPSQGVLDHVAIAGLTEQKADAWALVGLAVIAVERLEVELELAEVGRAEGLDLELDRDERLERAMEEQEVDEEVLLADLHRELLANEAEVAPQLEQEGLEVRDECALEVSFAVSDVEPEEVERVRILERVHRLRVGLELDGRHVGLPEGHPLEERSADVAVEFALRPPLISRRAEVECAFLLALAASQDLEVLGPGDFSHQRCEIWGIHVGLPELTHPPEIRGGEPARPRLSRTEPIRQPLYGSAPPAVLVDLPAEEGSDVGVQIDQLPIDQPLGGLPMRSNEAEDLFEGCLLGLGGRDQRGRLRCVRHRGHEYQISGGSTLPGSVMRKAVGT